jgi:RNA polymerase sigma-70 factor (ECF subfamily)
MTGSRVFTAMTMPLTLPNLLTLAGTEVVRNEVDLARTLIAAASGDSGALARLYDTVARELYGLAIWRGRDRALAEDAVQEVFCRLASGRIRLPTNLASPRAWLLRCVRNAAVDLERRAPRTVTVETAEIELVLARGHLQEHPAEVAALSRAVAALAPKLREAVYLHAYLGMTFREAGAVLGIPTFTAASRYRVALGRLEKSLGGGR